MNCTSKLMSLAQEHNGNVPLEEAMEAAMKESFDAIESLVHSRKDLPRDGSAVVAQTVSGTIILGRFHESESAGCYLQLTRFNIFPWDAVLRWFYPNAILGGKGWV